ncbi:hypothetical protein GTA51_04800 [Desulfovibrio aerotolerans]|uniref:Uncharacterized protein n=1 Tax=Solidesulfovibrio aerotolerans TaxID=295255 RepID=A0A7C9MZL8_9BACT|nr:hypothetical protein [Solidesulfovibrio aerotolerans]MYL82457.1 hypothetical protein [Solidesulfovibrio aerotolerans]
MKLKKKSGQRVNISKTKGLALSLSAQSIMLERVKFKIEMKKLLNLLSSYGLSIISLEQISLLNQSLSDVVKRHEDLIAKRRK